MLAILVVNEHDVQNRVLQMDREFTIDELWSAANYLNEQFAGRTLATVRDRLLSDLTRTRESMDQLMRDAIVMAQQVFDSESQREQAYYLAGETSLMDFDEKISSS